MALTSGDLIKHLSKLGFSPESGAGSETVLVSRPTHHWLDDAGRHLMALEVRLDPDGHYTQVLGPAFASGNLFAEPDQAFALTETMTAFHLLRFVHAPDDGEIRPKIEHVNLAAEALGVEAVPSLIRLAMEIFDPTLTFLETLARTGRRDTWLLEADPPELQRQQARLRSLQEQVEAAERELDKVRQARTFSAPKLPKFI
ncbi:hypothetical protein [Mesoterricola silvestris]|uniref:Uncharacterized protein n=1 Tax=Mesoterricola silvestris TaxID=2927979 RepID=A0AA48GTP0_9BACT|nr:hypothetical protein [Mesoterricola silvestris]BDU74160.1 hypothetical protein METEAL_33340 [Mesoterricola silvestris]